MMELREEELIYDWNYAQDPAPPLSPPRLVDHTLAALRLTPSIQIPGLEAQQDILALLERLGLHHVCLGSWADPQVRRLSPTCRDLELRGWVEVPPGPLPPLELGVYFSHRQAGWRDFCQQSQGPGVLVIQDATRATPKELSAILSQLPGTPIQAVCLSDDGGRALPSGAQHLVQFVQLALQRLGLDLEIEWSGRNDRGLAVASALAAWKAGAQALHCAFFSLGEGCGLVSTEQLLVNLTLAGSLRRDLKGLGEVSQRLASILGFPLHANLPIIGADAFRTGTGVHAAAILKAQKKGHDWLADLIYSGVPASQFGFRQQVEVGPMAGASNVHFWLDQKGLERTPERVQAILAEAKNSQRILSEDELLAIVGQADGGPP